MVYYRKYRPQRIEDLDSAQVRETLTAALSSATPPHAYLFTGPKGLGKTSTARIVAKVLNCERLASSKLASSSKSKKQLEVTLRPRLGRERYTLNAGVEPCNKCNQCVSITDGTNLDVLEIDGASNRGIDEIRDLREKIRLLPVAATKKVYIIDEVHMLTTEAFNALLKTLEEPPPHAVFILCTTEQHKVPATIVSRCFHISFTLATKEELVRAFERIVTGEKLSIEKGVLEKIATLSDGSFRDGTKVLDELVAVASGKQITQAMIEEKYKVGSIDTLLHALLSDLAKKDIKNGLTQINDLVKQGIDMKFFVQELITELHAMLLEKIGVEGERSSSKGAEFTVSQLKQLLSLLTEASGQIKYAVLSQIPLELALIEYSQAQNQSESHATSNVAEAEPIRKQVQHDKEKVQAASGQSISTESNDDIWRKLIDLVKQSNQSIAGVLRGCSLENFDGKAMVITTKFTFHKEKLEDKKAQQLLEGALRELTGNSVGIRVSLKQS